MDKTKSKFSVFKNLVSLCLIFASSLVFAPSAGVLRTIPFAFLAGALSGLLGTKTAICSAFSAAMTLCIYLVSGRSVLESIFFCAFGALLVFFGTYFTRFLALLFKTKNSSVKVKCAFLAVVFLTLTIVLSVVLSGDVFSYIKHDKANREYVSKSYGDNAWVNYTYYTPLSAEYRTYVTFTDTVKIDDKDTQVFYGEDDSVYVSDKKGKLNDDVRNYFEKKILANAEHELESIVAGVSYGFKVIGSDIDFPKDELVDMSLSYTEYLDRINYVVLFDSIIMEDEKDKFVSVCEETFSNLKASGFVYSNIVFCAGDANEIVYSMSADMKTDVKSINHAVKDYEEKQTQKYSVTQQDILAYWQNN